MNEQIENSENEFLWKLLANPADPSHSYIYNLQLVVNDHPQSGLLRALLVPKGDDQHLKHAAAYFTPGTLHKMATNLSGLPQVSDKQIAFVEENNYVPRTYVNPMAEPFTPPVVDDSDTNYFHVEEDDASTSSEQDESVETVDTYADNDINSSEAAEIAQLPETEHIEDEVYDEIAPHNESPISINPPAADDVAAPEISEDEKTDEYPWLVNEQGDTEVDADTTGEEAEETIEYPWFIDQSGDEQVESVQEEETAQDSEEPADENLLAKEYEEHLARVTAANTNTPYYTFEEEEDTAGDAIDDEVYDEIVSIEDIGLEQLAILDKVDSEETAGTISTTAANTTYPDTNEGASEEQYEASEQAHEHVITPAQQASASIPVVAANSIKAARGSGSKTVSRYNDEKMPYSFMWWLDKTRKEHAEVYQPYTAPTNSVKPPAARQETPQPQDVKPVLADELQQQYFENIFNANSINALDPLPPQPQATEIPARKEDKIIERFIQEEPQIKHPSTVKLNSENKAKKSSEDRDELVTETLAKIYTEQMLYHKAIGTYKKLMLKYPEKSLYFAGQIEQLEKKIN